MNIWDDTLGNRIYHLEYEMLTVNQEEETRKLIEYLDIGWDANCLSPQTNKRAISTASNFQVREKVYQGSSEKWKVYEPYLNGAFDSLLQR